MLTSPTLSVVFTIVFAVTGAYSLVRWAVPGPASPGAADRVAELFHLLMSLAMIAMIWGWTGGPDHPSGLTQFVVFGLFAVWFVARLIVGTSGYAQASNTYHAVTAAAMVWMVVALPPAGPGAPMPGMPGMPGMPMSAAGASTGVTVGTCAFIVLLAAAAVLWGFRAFHGDACAPPEPGPEAAGSVAAGGGSPVAAPSVVSRRTAPRVDACCHLLMSLGTGGLLLAMV